MRAFVPGLYKIRLRVFSDTTLKMIAVGELVFIMHTSLPINSASHCDTIITFLTQHGTVEQAGFSFRGADGPFGEWFEKV